ncbi:ectoine hydroxylase, partial [Pedobacter himalayensis]
MTETLRRHHDTYPTRTGRHDTVLDRPGPVVRGSAANGPIDAQTLQGFESKGYLSVERLVGPEELDLLRAELARMSQ